jgi:hypothetical protein
MKSKRTGFFEHVETVTKKTFAQKESHRLNSESIFEPVSLKNFLDAFVGEEACAEYMKRHEKLVGSFVAFNHFTFMGHDDVSEDPYGAMANYLSRGAALIPKPCTRGFDSMIPLVLADGRLSFIYIQTKFGKSFEGKSPSPADVFLSSPHIAFGDKIGKKDEGVPYAYIYHHITASPFDFKIFPTKAGKFSKVRPPKTRKLPESIETDAENFHFPCLFIQGVKLDASSNIHKLTKYFKDKPDNTWMDTHPNYKNTWCRPCKKIQYGTINQNGKTIYRG